MVTISLCMIVKNEEAVLARCLDSVREAVDEIIIVDTGSTDRTREIAAAYTDRVLDFVWVDDFSAARNFAFEQVTMDYQMWLDADDIFPDEERQKLLALKAALDPAVDMVTMRYHTHFNAAGRPILTSTRERLLRRERDYRWIDPVHECIPLNGNILYSDIAVWHQKPPSEGISTRNLDIYSALERSGKPLTPRQLYYYARELRDHGRDAESAERFERFLEGGLGWVEDNIAACHALAICRRRLGQERAVLPALLRSFQYAAPRAEVCCELGYCYMRQDEYGRALEWFGVALALEPPQTLGFVQREFHDYVPLLESCVCCCRLGEFERAADFNERAGALRPDSTAVQQNRHYLASVRGC